MPKVSCDSCLHPQTTRVIAQDSQSLTSSEGMTDTIDEGLYRGALDMGDSDSATSRALNRLVRYILIFSVKYCTAS